MKTATQDGDGDIRFQQRLGGKCSQSTNCLRRNNLQLSFQVRLAYCNFRRQGIAIAGRTALEHVQDKHVFAAERAGGEDLVQQLAGGPHERDKRLGHANGSFLFPQMTMSEEARREAEQLDWSPNFVDYLFLAFNTSTAFSPTDVPVLSRWAKILMMLQSVLSLLIIALLAARAVNIL